MFERGVALLSLDTEQIWGYLDLFTEQQFEKQFPDSLLAHEKLLENLVSAGISATWFIVGGLALHRNEGARDERMAGLPQIWTRRIPAGSEVTKPLWYRRAFVGRLLAAKPCQEVGLHGGLTHLIWTAKEAVPKVLNCELQQGCAALEAAGVKPVSFSFPRDEAARHELLPGHGIGCYRGRTPVLAFELGCTPAGKFLRVLDELRAATPPPVWPREVLPGLWNIPSSLFLYPISRSRVVVAPARTRIERFRRGLEAAIRVRGIFHFCLHPENLTESPGGFRMFQEMLEILTRRRDCGDVEVLTMQEAARRAGRVPLEAQAAVTSNISSYGSDCCSHD